MSLATIAWYGKLPSHGDFLQRRAPEQFVSVWDDWLQRCLAHTREQLGSDWLQTYLTSPVWRFFLCDGVIGAASFAGVVLPSVDKVGRYFPLTIFTQLPSDLPPMAIAIHGRDWLRSIETIALGALENLDLRLEDFDAALEASADLLAQVEQYYGPSLDGQFPLGADYWRLPMSSSDRVAAALIDPLMAIARRTLQPMSLWWTDGSEQVAASCLLARALPEPARVTAMMDGAWSTAGWSGEFDDIVLARPLAAELSYEVKSAGCTDAGIRPMNQDRCLEHPNAGMWVVADGMGGHSRGEYASQLVVDVVRSTEPEATLSAALQSARVALARANADLMRAAVTGHHDQDHRSGSTVVLLTIRREQWGVLWAGDSRAYLLRNQELMALTRDHSNRAIQLPFDAARPAASTDEITRAVGGELLLQLDYNTGQICGGDRFLLCSDGLHGPLAHEQLRQILIEGGAAQAAAQLLIDSAIKAGSRDNVTALVIDVIVS
jgi:type VI secretion system protein ImpM